MQIAKEEMAKVFTEWLNRYNANPAEFNDYDTVTSDYGDNCTEYFCKLLGEIR